MANLLPLAKFREDDLNGNPLAGGKVYTYAAGTTTPAVSYTDATGTTPNANPVILDSSGRAAIYLGNESYKIVVTDANDVVQYTSDGISAVASASDVIYRWAGTAGGTGNALTLTPSVAATSYQTGVRYAFLASNNNSGAATVNVSGLGAKAIKRKDGTDVSAGEIAAGSMYSMTYDGTNFRVHELADSTLVSGQTADTDPDQRLDYLLTYDTSAGSMKKALMYLVSEPKVRTETDNYTATINDGIILMNASASKTVTLPAASTAARKTLTIKKIDSSLAVRITIDGNSAETIDGATTTTLATQYESVTLYCDGSNWHTIERFIPSGTTSYTPTGAWTNNTTYRGKWRRDGDRMVGDVQLVLSGAPTSATLHFDLPSGVAIDTAKLNDLTGAGSGVVGQSLGFGYAYDSSPGAYYDATLAYNNTTSILVISISADGPFSQAAPFTWASGDKLSLQFDVPIVGWAG